MKASKLLSACVTLGHSRHLVWLLTLLLCVASTTLFGQTVQMVRLSDLQTSIQGEKDRIQVINFWATWCGPCIKELPLLEKLHANRKDVHVRLVSLDMDLDPNPEKVRSFVMRKKLQSEVIILDERNPNEWIDKVEKSWSGAIPSTLIINNKNGKRKFVERALLEGELEKLIAEIQ